MYQILLLIILSLSASAAEPIRALHQYNAPSEELTIKVPSARVVVADYALIRQDFVETQNFTESEIDAWLLKNAGFMARTQVFNVISEKLHDAIPVEYEFQKAYRPEDYGRGLVFKTESGLLDGKGFGSRDPRPGTNTNGLMELSQALREFIMEKTVNQIARLSHGLFDTVGTYAVIDWGFDIHMQDGSHTPAGAVLRQAHTREYWNFNSNLAKDRALTVELYLRKFGITSTGLSSTLRNQPRNSFDLINIQGKTFGQEHSVIVDFGTFVRVPEGYTFDKPLAVRATRFGSIAAVSGAEEAGANRFIGVPEVLLDPRDPHQESFVSKALYEELVPASRFSVNDGSELVPETDKLSEACEDFIQKKRKENPSKASYAAFVKHYLCNSESLLK